jgi:Helix-turn-helix
MTTSQSVVALSNPSGAERVAPGVFGYFQARNKYNAYDLVMHEFASSNLSQADLARRLGKGPDQVSRLLSGPGNWTLDTLSDLMFAISGAAPVYGKEYPLSQPRRNQRGPDWLYPDPVEKSLSDTSNTAEIVLPAPARALE